jgi:hypothetical protein
MASSASWLAREPERTGRRCRMRAARFYCGLRAWHSTTANALLFPAPVPAKTDVAWKTDEPATLDAAGAEVGESSGSRNQQSHIPSGARQPADVWMRS